MPIHVRGTILVGITMNSLRPPYDWRIPYDGRCVTFNDKAVVIRAGCWCRMYVKAIH